MSYTPIVRHRFLWFAVAALAIVTPAPRASATEILAVNRESTMTATQIHQFTAPLFSGYPREAPRYGAEIQELRIATQYPDGTPTEARVQVFLPTTASENIRGVYLFMPGTTGLIEPCRPSREHVAGIHWGLYRAHTLAFTGEGYIGILPDYLGFEDWTFVQPYFHAESGARIIFDALHAVDQWIRPHLPEGIGELRRVAGGFSQGGHAIFAAADRNHTMARGLPLHGVVGYGATTSIEPMLLAYPSLAPMLVQAFLEVYGRQRINPALILREPWATTLEYDTTRQCVGAMQGYYPGRAEELFRQDFLRALQTGTVAHTFPAIGELFRDNRSGRTPHGVPAFLAQGGNDIVIPPEDQKQFVRELQELGNPVEFRLYENARHDTRQIAFRDVLHWMQQLPY